jgi:hypothetical protein
MDGSRLAFLEASLVYLRCDEMWELSLDSLKYRLFHYLRQVRSHHNGSDLVECTGALCECLL